jgi:hypothetical protein
MPRSRLQKNKGKLSQRTQRTSQEHPERGNPASNENFIEMILDMVNQNVQETLKKFQESKNREFEKAQEQIKETIEALYKQQSETKNTINKEINELRMKIDNIKEDMETTEKKNKTEIQNKMES